MNIILSLAMFMWGVICGMALMQSAARGAELVTASTYGDKYDMRRTGETRTATGRRLDPSGNFVAHRTLPLGTWLTLTRGRYTAVVKVNDRGPFVRGRDLDLVPYVNTQLRCYGLCRVRVEPWRPTVLPRPRPLPQEPTFAWGEE